MPPTEEYRIQFDQLKRREFIVLLGGASMWPLAARAEQPAMPVIGLLDSTSPDVRANLLRSFRQGLNEAGFVEGRNVAIEYRWSDGQYDRVPELANDLVRRQVTVIATIDGSASAMAAKAATSTIPVIFRIGADPVALGLVASLNRPGGNVTGVTSLTVEVGPKRLEVLHQLVPNATVMAMLLNPTSPFGETLTTDLQAAARMLGPRIHVLHASTERDLNSAFAKLLQLRVGGLVVGSDAFFNSQNEQLAALTVRHAMPAVYQYREFVAAGGLMSYGGSLEDSYRLTGVYTGRVLKGEKPADLPVQQSTKLELFINLKTAKALSLTVPLSLLGRADEVIE
jgi:putative tryptophan/tyrosine transport system substrate-binding protein